MAKKKKQYPNKRRNTIIGLIITLAVIAVIGAGCGAYYVWDKNEKSYIATVAGEKVPSALYRLNILEQMMHVEEQYTADFWNMGELAINMVKDAAYERTVSTHLTSVKAREYGTISVTPEQLEEIETATTEFMELYPPEYLDYIGMTRDELREVLLEQVYADNLYNKVTESYEFDEAAFEEDFTAYFADEEANLTLYAANLILTDDEESINNALASLESGADFKDVMAEYSVEYVAPSAGTDEPGDSGEVGVAASAEDNGEAMTEPNEDSDEDSENDSSLIGTIPFEVDPNRYEWYGQNLPDAIADTVKAMSVGEVSHVIELTEDDNITVSGYVIVKLLNVVEADEETIRESYKESVYIPGRKNEDIYDPLYSEWVEEIEVVKNEKAFKAAKLFGQ